MPQSRFPYSIFILILVAALFLVACSAASAPDQSRDIAVLEKAAGMPPGAPAMEAPAPMAPESASQIANQAQTVERIVIQNGNLTLVVVDPGKSMEAIKQMAKEMGGFVVSANLYKEKLSSGAEAPRGSITIRVPAERLDEAMRKIKSESGQDPISENLTSQDVTSEYVDLQSRLKNLEAAEAELQEILGSAQRTEDVLAVYNQLVQIREQIETVKGQIKYYEQSAALSAISVELIADEAIQPLQIGGWQPQGIIKNAVEALIKTIQFVINFLIWVVLYLLPVLLILFVIFVLPPLLLIRYLRRRSARKKAANNPPPSPPTV
jgi:hypothetical protein